MIKFFTQRKGIIMKDKWERSIITLKDVNSYLNLKNINIEGNK
jgi:hypothetical protein